MTKISVEGFYTCDGKEDTAERIKSVDLLRSKEEKRFIRIEGTKNFRSLSDSPDADGSKRCKP